MAEMEDLLLWQSGYDDCQNGFPRQTHPTDAMQTEYDRGYDAAKSLSQRELTPPNRIVIVRNTKVV